MKGPSGDQVQDFRDKISEKFEFVARTRGPYRFCFTNRSPYREKVDFDVHSNHFSTFDQHAQDGEPYMNGLVNFVTSYSLCWSILRL